MMDSIDVSTLKEWPTGKVGYVALIGRPNTGKSTLLNGLLDFHLAAVSRMPQTTRRYGLGILSDENSQMLFLDAPGVHVPRDVLGEAMFGTVTRVLEEADVIVCLADPTRTPGEEDQLVAERVAAASAPVLLVINKVDAAEPQQVDAMVSFYRDYLPDKPVLQLSALNGSGFAPLLDALRERLPEGPFLYPPDQVTDEIERDIAAELIREACLEVLKQEVPHALAVTVDEWKQDGQRTRISATLHVERLAQKKIVVGKAGSMIKILRSRAVEALAELCPEGVTLKLWVTVSRDWRRKKSMLRQFGLLGHG